MTEGRFFPPEPRTQAKTEKFLPCLPFPKDGFF